MCGLIGVVDFSGSIEKHELFMNWALNDLEKRGPDQRGLWTDESAGVSFGFRRLSIRDLTAAGEQPMLSPFRNYTMIYNGETYNISELLDWGAIKISELRGHSDSEIILACIEKRGVHETLKKMDGMFAIALYDQCNQKLYLARDLAGIKPLYFGINKRGLVFSSHYHHVTSHTFFRNGSFDENTLVNYFRFGFIQEGEGLLADTFFLPHGHIAEFDLKSNWNWSPYVSFNHDTSGEKTQNNKQLIDVYRSVVESQLVGDVPIGTLMSGGVDSTLTTAIAVERQTEIKAYTIGVNDSYLDETEEAKRFASSCNISQQIHQVLDDEAIGLIDQYEESAAEPLADFSSLITLKVCEVAKREKTVVLSGDGGDELFWGYDRFYTACQHYKFLAQPIIPKLLTVILRKIKGKIKGNKIPFNLPKAENFPEYYLTVQGIPGNGRWVDKLFNTPPKKTAPYLYVLLNKNFANHNDAMIFAKNLEFHIHMQRVLLKVDRASMYHSLEVRPPMLSRTFIELSRRYTFEECMDGRLGKIPLRDALDTFLPLGTESSGIKKGFSPPLERWLREVLKERVEKRIMKIPKTLASYINLETIKTIWAEHQEGKNNSWMIWAVYTLFVWVENKMFTYEN